MKLVVFAALAASLPLAPVMAQVAAPAAAPAVQTYVQPQVALAAAPQVREAMLPANTEVVLTLNSYLSSKTHKIGDKFALSVAKDVMVGGNVVIPKGSRAVGVVTMRTGNGGFGKSGKMEMGFRYIDLGDRRIPIEGNHRQEGAGNTAATIGAVVAAGVVGGLIVKGKSARVPEGREFAAHTLEAVPVVLSDSGAAVIAASYNPSPVNMNVETEKQRKARQKAEKAAGKKRG